MTAKVSHSLFSRTVSGCHTAQDATWRCTAKLPAPALRRWIASVWELDGVVPAMWERELPRGSVSIVVNLAGPHTLIDAGVARALPAAWITGLHEQALVTAVGGRSWTCGARLTIEGAYRLLQVPAHELANQVVDLESVGGRPVRQLLARIDEARTVEDRLALLGSYLVERLTQPSHWDPVVSWALDHIVSHPSATPVAWLARSAGWSEKRLYRRFLESVGMGPRSVARIARFHAVLCMLHEQPTASLATVAHELGYCDQAHLAREFRELACMTATQYLRGRAYSLDYGYARVEPSETSKT